MQNNKSMNNEKSKLEAQQEQLDIPVVICSCENNDACTKEENGNGEWKDYCWKCKCFRN